MINKINIVLGAYELIRISGLTVKSSPEDIITALQVLDDKMAEMKPTLDMKYSQPLEYGMSDPNDYSGLSASLVGAVKKILALELVTFFGKEAPASLVNNYQDGLRSIEHQVVHVGNMVNPSTLPIGSGNEYNYYSPKFYLEPNTDDGADNYFITDKFQLESNLNPWLDGEDLTTVTYTAHTGIVITNDSFADGKVVATISFNDVGQFTLCRTVDTATRSMTEKFIYNVIECN